MWAFITEHLLEIIFSLVAAGALAFCKYLHTQMKKYKRMLDEQQQEKLEATINARLEPILVEIEKLKDLIKETGSIEKNHISLIVSSYRFRLIQLCKEFIHQGFMTQDQYDQLTEFYKLYHALGGNGQAQEYYETAMKLPVHDK